MTELNGFKFTARYTRACGRGRPPKVEWTPERLERLKDLCLRGASLDDLTIAFDGLGVTTMAVGMREVIRLMAACPDSGQ